MNRMYCGWGGHGGSLRLILHDRSVQLKRTVNSDYWGAGRGGKSRAGLYTQ